MVLLDSCVWIELFADGPLADAYVELYFGDLDEVYLSPIVLAEVLKWLARANVDDDARLMAVAGMVNAQPVPLHLGHAVHAARLAHTLGLPLADALILSQAEVLGVDLVTQDGHFRDLPGVRFHEHPSQHPDPTKRKGRRLRRSG